MYTKEQYKQRFRSFDNDELIENALRELTPEAKQATLELLAERGLDGEALQLKVSEVRRAQFQRGGVTNQCDYCGRTIVGARVVDGVQKFCGEQCRKESRLMARSVDMPADVIHDRAVAMRTEACPVCRKAAGMVEMRPCHSNFSAIFFSYRSTQYHLCCRTCGKRASLHAIVASLLMGWWSVRGLFWTPAAIWKNISAIRAPNPSVPTPQLLHRARLDLAERLPDNVEQLFANAKGLGYLASFPGQGLSQ